MSGNAVGCASAVSVRVNDLDLVVDLADGRTITVSVAWFSRIAMGTQKECENWSLIGGGHGIHWADLDEDVSAESLLTGRRSRESDSSSRTWMESHSGDPGILWTESAAANTRASTNGCL